MKAGTLAIIVGLVVVGSCRPGAVDLRQLKAEAARKRACLTNCSDERLEPLCAASDADKPKSFANVCVLQNYNCEHNGKLKEIMKGECPGTQGILTK